MSGDLRKLLDDLDAAREKATPGEWGSYWDDHIGSGVEILPGGGVRVDHFVALIADEDYRADTDDKPSSTSPGADAALIVAAVNNLPRLTAAVRAVLDLADSLDRDPLVVMQATGDALRSILTAALEPDPPDGGTA